MHPLIHTQSGSNHWKKLLGWSQRRRFFQRALTGSPDHNSGAILAADDVYTSRCRKEVSWIHWLLTCDTGYNGNVWRQQKTGCKDASEFRENTLGYHAFQTARQCVRGELRNMQVAGHINHHKLKLKLSIRSQGCVVVLLCCSG